MNTNRLFSVVVGMILAGLSACDDGDGGSADAAPSPDGGADAGAAMDAGGDGPPPIALGAGSQPGIAIDPDGASYIAWVGPENNTTSLSFCRLPRRARACVASIKLTPPGTSLSRPFVAVSGTTVHVLSYRYGIEPGGTTGVYLVTSRDGGATFEPARQVGTVEFSAAAQAADGTVSLTTHAVTRGLLYQSVSLADATPAAMAEVTLSTTHLYAGAVGFEGGMTPVVAFANGGGDLQLRRHLGMGDRNDPASWSPPVDAGKGDRMHFAGGPKGLFLLGQVPLGGLHLRRYEAATGTLSAGAPVPDGTGELAHAQLLQDSTGRLHVLWPRIEAFGVHLYRSTSDDGGATWKQAILTTDDSFSDVDAALAPDQIGVAVWGAASSAGSQIHAVAFGGQ